MSHQLEHLLQFMSRTQVSQMFYIQLSDQLSKYSYTQIVRTSVYTELRYLSIYLSCLISKQVLLNSSNRVSLFKFSSQFWNKTLQYVWICGWTIQNSWFVLFCSSNISHSNHYQELYILIIIDKILFTTYWDFF